MGIFFVYILKSAICLVLFYLFYSLLLSRETFHRFNRFALLGLLLFSSLLPLVEVSVKQPTEVTATLISLEEWLVSDEPLEEALPVARKPQGVPLVEWMLLAYLAGIVFFALRHLWALGQMIALLRSGHIETLCATMDGKPLPGALDGKGVRLVVHERETAPFSWMKFIVISRKDLEENGREILIHELAHIRLRHSWDLLAADVCILLQWFNPAAWLLKQELQNIHEYEADETVIREGVNARQYQLLLIKKAVGTRLYSMANSFNHSKLKKRITMMLKEKSSPWARLKYLYVLPVAAVTLSAFARPEAVETSEEISAVKVNDLVSIAKAFPTKTPQDTVRKELEGIAAAGSAPQGRAVERNAQEGDATERESQERKAAEADVYTVVDEQPQFPGGQQELKSYLDSRMRYPASCREAGVQGCVIVQFIVDKEGNVCDPKVLRKVHDGLDTEAVRLVEEMPRWTPGRMKGEPVASRFTLPVMFRLTDNGQEETERDTADSGARLFISSTVNGQTVISGKHLLIIVDGKECGNNLDGLRPDQIKCMEIRKGEEFVPVYGEKAKDGVLFITLKEMDEWSDTDRSASAGEARPDTRQEGASGRQIVPPLQEGVVRNGQGEAIAGAKVSVEGTVRGTVTDRNGLFKIEARPGEKLKIAYVGMESASVKVKKGKGILDIILKQE